MEHGYTLREAAVEVGASVSWLRGLIRRGTIDPAKVQGKHGPEYRLNDGDLEAARSAYPDKASRSAGTRLARVEELQADYTRVLVEMSAERARAEAERERAERAEDALARERERVEALKSLGVVDRLLGRHKRV